MLFVLLLKVRYEVVVLRCSRFVWLLFLMCLVEVMCCLWEIDERGGEEQLNTPITVEITRWCPENKAWYVGGGMIVRGRVIG